MIKGGGATNRKFRLFSASSKPPSRLPKSAIATKLQSSEMALGLIKRKQFTANEIAYMLRYNDSSAFRRAFRRWTGKSPGEMLKVG